MNKNNIYKPKIYRPWINKPKIGIYISKENKSILSNNPDDFVFKPERPTASIKKRLSLKVTTSSTAPGVGVTQYQHNFGYIPQVICFVTTGQTRQGIFGYDPSFTYLNVPGTFQTGDEILVGDNFEVFDCYADEHNLWVEAYRYTLYFGPDPDTGIPGWITVYFEEDYTFDILLLMEEAK